MNDMLPSNEVTEDDYLIYTRGKIVAIAQAMLDEEIGVIAGSQKLAAYSAGLYKVADGYLDEEYFTPFEVVYSETVHLPVDGERRNWSEEALERKDGEIAAFEAQAKERIFEACRGLIKRYELPFPRT